MDTAALEKALGPSKALWDAILTHLDQVCPEHTREWKNYGKKHGWQLKVSRGKRALVYLIPSEGSFRAAMALSETAVSNLRAAGIPPELTQEIESSKVFPEGRPARVVVTKKADVALVKKLLGLKLAS